LRWRKTIADGFYALKVMRKTNTAVDDVTVGVAKKLIASGKIPRD
jgi:hypothetical protein